MLELIARCQCGRTNTFRAHHLDKIVDEMRAAGWHFIFARHLHSDGATFTLWGCSTACSLNLKPALRCFALPT